MFHESDGLSDDLEKLEELYGKYGEATPTV